MGADIYQRADRVEEDVQMDRICKRNHRWLGLALTLLAVLLYVALPQAAVAQTAPPPNDDDRPSALEQNQEPPVRRVGENLANLDLREEGPAPDRAWADLAGRKTVISYRVTPGDTLWRIAAAHNLTIDSLRWANPALRHNPDVLAEGQILRIPPVNGALHDVAPGDTVESIAAEWNVAPADIRNYWPNRLAGYSQPAVGDVVVVPHGTQNVDLPVPTPVAGYDFAWPISGWVSQGYHPGHRAVDIAGPYGANVYASRAGKVISTGWNPAGYGYLIKIQHSNGYITYYSHLKGYWIEAGQWVNPGDLIGAVGSTGNSTGPHVHFEIRHNGALLNPLDLLPPR